MLQQLKGGNVAKEEVMEFSGTVTELLPNAMFRVKLDNEHEILAHTAGKMRKHRIRVLAGDRVNVAQAVPLSVPIRTNGRKLAEPQYAAAAGLD